MQQKRLISDGGMKRPTLTLAPMGMVAPWRCQELQIFGRASSAFVHWAMESITLTNQHKTLDSFIDWKFDSNWLNFETKMTEKPLKITYSLQIINLTFSSSKQSFEEETSLSIIDDENLEMKTYWRHTHGLQALFDILKTKP